MIGYWSFDETNWPSDWSGLPPISFTNINSVPSWSYNALQVDSTNAAWLQYRVIETNGITNLICTNGAVELWFNPDWAGTNLGGTGPRNWGMLIDAGAWTSNSSYGWWSLYVNPAGTGIYFSGQTNTGLGTDYLSAPISWDSNEWHHILLNYSPTNSQLYLDGQLATNGSGVAYYPGPNALTNGFFVGSDCIGQSQCRGQIEDLFTYDGQFDSNGASGEYEGYVWGGFVYPLPDSGGGDVPIGGGLGMAFSMSSSQSPSSFQTFTTNDFWLEVLRLGTNAYNTNTNNVTLLLHGTIPEIVYQLQSTTNLNRTNTVWTVEQNLVGAEDTNFTPTTVSMTGRKTVFFRALAYTLDSDGNGLPDWWELKYFGQIGIDPYASFAGDGLNNLQKFQLGLNPLTYFNPNPPPGFFGSLVGSNVFLEWQYAPGPVSNYAVQRGIFNTNTGNFDYAQIALLSSNATFFEDAGAITNSNSQSNIYTMEAVYPGGAFSGTNTWQVYWYQGYGYPGATPPQPGAVNACVDSSGTNVIVTWSSAQGPVVGYKILHGYLNTTTWTTTYVTAANVNSNVFSYTIGGAISNSPNVIDVFDVQAVFTGGALSLPVEVSLSAGALNGPAAPANFIGYLDSTGTNAYLYWSLSPGSVIGYCIFGYTRTTGVSARLALVGPTATSYFATNPSAYDALYIIATYTDGSVSRAAFWFPSATPPAPTSLYACLDSTRTNVVLYWQPVPLLATGYTIQRSYDPNYYGYQTLTNVNAATKTYTDRDTFSNPDFSNNFAAGTISYQITATYPNGGVSAPVAASISSTPPPAANLSVALDSTGENAVLSWTPSIGPVSQYAILRGIYNPSTGVTSFTQIATVTATTTTFTDTAADDNGIAQDNVYEVVANYSGWTNSPPDASHVTGFPASPTNTLSVSAQLVRNETGQWQLMFPYIPTNVSTIAFFCYGYDYGDDIAFRDYGNDVYYTSENDIPVSNIVNGTYLIPDYLMTNWFPNNWSGKNFVIQPIDTGGNYGAVCSAGFERYDMPRFVDGRRQLKQNLVFALREATISQPSVRIFEEHYWNNPFFQNLMIPGDTNYVESSCFHSSVMNKLYNTFYVNYVNFDDMWPFTANYQSHANLYDTNFSGTLFDWQSDPSWGYYSYPWYFIGPITQNPPAPVLGISDPYWIAQDGNNLTDVGAYTNGSTLYLQTGIRNVYGLNYTAALVNPAHYGVDPTNFNTVWYPNVTLSPGGSIALANVTSFYSQTVDPALSLLDYYFALVNTPGTGLTGDNTPTQFYQYPAVPGFNNAKQTGLLITSVGTPTVVGGWARYSIQNGYADKRAYLGQYFMTNAFVVSNGVVTTNITGVVSPYGDFLPTQPGTVALVTMPDIDSGIQSTCAVQVISLNVDANHDGQMNVGYFSPDFTATNKPFVFWANNDYDRLEYDADDNTNYEDSVLVAGCPYTPNQDTKDNNYRDASGRRVIPTKRDLQDFTRLWLAGITTNLLTNLPSGSTITLSWGDVGSPNTNNPTIDLFAAAEANGGIGYLTNETVASQQTNIALCPYIGRLGPGSSIQLNASTFSNHWAGNYFIWCGEAYGSGALTLTIADASSNVLAQTVAYIQIVDIKQMYERWTIGDAPTIVPTTNAIPAVEDLPPFTQAFQYPYDPATDANTPYILFVHGWNMTRNDKDRFAETAFKRLYWQGYQGRFGLFRWPTDNGFKGTLSQLFSDSTQKDNYDRSEYQAWQSAAGLRNKLNDLNAKYSGHVYLLAHSMGNVVAGEALRLSGSTQVVNTYVASQGAVSAHTYDTNVPTYSFSYPPFSSSADTPNIYGGWFASNNGNGAGRIINFYNTNDYALARGHWQLDQLFKPDQAVLESGVNWYYNYSGSTNDPPPWNNFYKQNSDGSTVIGFNIVTSLNNRYEVMAFDAQSYTTALGATPGVSHVAANVNITTLWPSPDPLGNNYGSHFYHSAEFRGDAAPEWNYWHLLLTSPTTGFNISTP